MSEFFDEKNNQNQNIDKDNNFEENQSNFSQEQQEKLRNIMPNYSQHFSIWDYRVGFGRRFGAAILDFVFVGIIAGILYYVTGILDEIMNMGFGAFMDPELMMEFAKDSVPISLLVSVIYFSTEILLSGSPGKHLLGIIIADSEMTYASYSKLSLRFILKHLDFIFLAIYVLTWNNLFNTLSSMVGWIIIIGFFFVFRASKEALYDSIAKTAVYFKKEVDSNQETKSMNNYTQI